MYIICILKIYFLRLIFLPVPLPKFVSLCYSLNNCVQNSCSDLICLPAWKDNGLKGLHFAMGNSWCRDSWISPFWEGVTQPKQDWNFQNHKIQMSTSYKRHSCGILSQQRNHANTLCLLSSLPWATWWWGFNGFSSMEDKRKYAGFSNDRWSVSHIWLWWNSPMKAILGRKGFLFLFLFWAQSLRLSFIMTGRHGGRNMRSLVTLCHIASSVRKQWGRLVLTLLSLFIQAGTPAYRSLQFRMGFCCGILF